MPFIFFDIDYTLIDTDKLRSRLSDAFQQTLNITAQQYKDVISNYTSALASSTDFNPDEFISFLAPKYDFLIADLEKVYWHNPQFYQESLYPEVLRVLKRMKGEYNMGIFSEGFIKYQTAKLKESGILNFFDPKNIYIFRRKLLPENLANFPAGSLVIDDDPVNVKALLNLPQVVPIWINRKNASTHPQARTITSLLALLD